MDEGGGAAECSGIPLGFTAWRSMRRLQRSEKAHTESCSNAEIKTRDRSSPLKSSWNRRMTRLLKESRSGRSGCSRYKKNKQQPQHTHNKQVTVLKYILCVHMMSKSDSSTLYSILPFPSRLKMNPRLLIQPEWYLNRFSYYLHYVKVNIYDSVHCSTERKKEKKPISELFIKGSLNQFFKKREI